MLAIYKREMRSYFTSPTGYVFIAVFLFLNALIFSLFTILSNYVLGYGSSVGSYLRYIMFAMFIIIPVLTMKTFSEDKRSKTEQLILTSPISLTGMVVGKFLAAFTMFAGTYVIGAVINFPLLYRFIAEGSRVNTPMIIAGSIGVLLIGAAFISIGMFMSAVTENQIVAAIGAMGIILVTLTLNLLGSFIDSYAVRAVINWICITSRFGNFGSGIVDFAALLYYFSISSIFIFLTVRIYEKRRWS